MKHGIILILVTANLLAMEENTEATRIIDFDVAEAAAFADACRHLSFQFKTTSGSFLHWGTTKKSTQRSYCLELNDAHNYYTSLESWASETHPPSEINAENEKKFKKFIAFNKPTTPSMELLLKEIGHYAELMKNTNNNSAIPFEQRYLKRMRRLNLIITCATAKLLTPDQYLTHINETAKENRKKLKSTLEKRDSRSLMEILKEHPPLKWQQIIKEDIVTAPSDSIGTLPLSLKKDQPKKRWTWGSLRVK